MDIIQTSTCLGIDSNSNPLDINIKNKLLNKLLNRKIPILVAEISANHNGSLSKAKNLIDCAKKNGADLVKLQTYTPDTMTIKSKKSDFKILSNCSYPGLCLERTTNLALKSADVCI